MITCNLRGGVNPQTLNNLGQKAVEVAFLMAILKYWMFSTGIKTPRLMLHSSFVDNIGGGLLHFLILSGFKFRLTFS